MQFHRRLLNFWTGSVSRLWHSAGFVRRQRAMVVRPPRSLSYYARTAIYFLRLLFSASRLRLAWRLLSWGGLGLAVTLAAFWGWDWLYGKGWIWLSKDGEDPARTIRDIVLALAAPISIMLALWRSRIAAAGLLHDRYQRSAEMLGHPDLRSVRLGGIHALANLADEHRSTYHLQAMQVFAALVVERTNADKALKPVDSATDPAVGGETEGSNARELHLAEDVREALRLIAGRDRRQVALERKKRSRLNLSGAFLVRLVQMDAANFSNIDFSDANLSRARLWLAQFEGSILTGARLRDASLAKADLRKVDMRGADLTGARLIDADLRQADMGPRNRVGEWATSWKERLTTLRGAAMMGADMRGVVLYSADLQQAMLGGANLDNANLCKADLRRADLRAAVLYEANLTGANLTDANLGGWGADLRKANLTDANLTGANLSLAVLTDADLTDANLSGADFSRHHLERNPQSPEEVSPATGLTQDQLDQAKADPNCPPYLEGVLDSITKKTLVWRGRPLDDDS